MLNLLQESLKDRGSGLVTPPVNSPEIPSIEPDSSPWLTWDGTRFVARITEQKIEELLADDQKQNIPIENVRLDPAGDGLLEISFDVADTGTILPVNERICIIGRMQQEPETGKPWFEIEQARLGTMALPKIIIREMEEYLNNTMIRQLEIQKNVSVESASILGNVIRLEGERK
ncbi:MAG TPA: hypothetical protein DD727_00660 [Clostridiales bacterium]|nr:hypothetical protein [Clostridiales bacterium]